MFSIIYCCFHHLYCFRKFILSAAQTLLLLLFYQIDVILPVSINEHYSIQLISI